MEFTLHSSLAMADGSRRETVDAIATFDSDSLRLVGPEGNEDAFDLRDVIRIEAKDDAIRLDMCDGRCLGLDRTGGRHDELLGTICTSKNKLAIADLYPNEVPRTKGIEGELRKQSAHGTPGTLERCELRVYHDSLVILPERSEIIRLPILRLVSVGVEKYSLIVRSDDGRTIAISRLGRELEPARRAIANSMTDSRSRTLGPLKSLVPEAQGLEPWALATADGRMVGLAELEVGLPGVTAAIASRLESAGIGEYCRHLVSIGSGGLTRVGLRRRTGELGTVDEILMLVPIVSLNGGTSGNVLALDGTVQSGESRATCFFRIVSRDSFRSHASSIDEHDLIQAIDATSSALQSIGFRQDPFLLSGQGLAMAENSRHRHIINLIPGANELRQRFIGRVVHSSPDEWAERIGELLRFNVSAASDDAVFA